MRATVNIHLQDGDVISSYVEERAGYPVLNLGTCSVFGSALHLAQIIAACQSALQEMGEPLDEPLDEPLAPVSGESPEGYYWRRVSDNPNDAVISVERDHQDSVWPFFVDGTGSETAPRFCSYEDAVAEVDRYCTWASQTESE